MSDYITIQLSQHGNKKSGLYETIVSIEDAEYVMQYDWFVQDGNKYAARNVREDGKRHIVRLHRVIMSRMLERELLPIEFIDHIDGDGFNNTRPNLRLATRSQNGANRQKYKNNKSGYKGVTLNSRGKWSANIRVNKKRIHLGSFNTPEEAHKAYCDAAKQYHGDFANHG